MPFIPDFLLSNFQFCCTPYCARFFQYV